jgi:hypothetical protein
LAYYRSSANAHSTPVPLSECPQKWSLLWTGRKCLFGRKGFIWIKIFCQKIPKSGT